MLVQRHCDGQSGQQWRFWDNTWQIASAEDTSKCIDAGQMQAGSPLQLWDCNGYPQQAFGYDGDMETIYLTESASSSDASLCMDLPGGSSGEGQQIWVWSCLGAGSNQQWQVGEMPPHEPSPYPTPYPTPEPSPSPQVPGTIRSAASGQCLALNGPALNGQWLVQKACDGQESQQWRFQEGWQLATAEDTQKCVDAGAMQMGSYLQLWDCNGYPQQAIGYDDQIDTLFLAQSAASSDASFCVDLPGSSTDDGAQIWIWSCSGLANQQWQVVG